MVQSKRGGGGYIRIERVNLLADEDVLQMVIDNIGDAISEKDAVKILNTLYEEKLISHREGDLMLVAIDKATLKQSTHQAEDQLRARILVALLTRLRYE